MKREIKEKYELFNFENQELLNMKQQKIKDKYKYVCKSWNSFPNNLPIFENWFFEDNFVKNNVILVDEAESCRQQLIAIREGWTE